MKSALSVKAAQITSNSDIKTSEEENRGDDGSLSVRAENKALGAAMRLSAREGTRPPSSTYNHLALSYLSIHALISAT